jgi:succinoglycan biosynthesis protein ExoM
MDTVVICICTCNRPEGLRKLLTKIGMLEFEGDLKVLVVENHRNLAGRGVCRAMAPGYRWPLECFVEPEPGIAFARNRCVRGALAADARYIAMIDDDEWPEPGWLTALLDTQKKADYDVVVGPVIPSFEQEPPAWMVDGGYFAQDSNLTTSNILFKAELFRGLEREPFDARLALSGGEDSEFLRWLSARGMRWTGCADAVVHEFVPANRTTAKWLLQRMYRMGNNFVRFGRLNAPGPRAELRRLATTGRMAIDATYYLILGLFSGNARREGIHKWAETVGRMAAHVGRAYFEYADMHKKESTDQEGMRPQIPG